MAQITIDTTNPDDVKLMQSLLDAGLLGHFLANGDGSVDVDSAVDALLSAVGEDARDLLEEFMVQTAAGPTTLEKVATALGVEYSVVKGRKLNLGRSVKKVQRTFPGMPDPITSTWDATEKKSVFTMEPNVRKAVEDWLAAHYPDSEDAS